MLSGIIFVLTGVFFLFQNFSELRVDTKSYPYQMIELKHLSAKKPQSLAYGINLKGEAIGQSRGDDGFWHSVIWSSDGQVKDLGLREDYKADQKTLPRQNEIHGAQPFSPKGVWIGPSKEFGRQDPACKGECKRLGELSEDVQLGYSKQANIQWGYIRVRGKTSMQISPLSKGFDIFPNSVNTHSQVVGWGTTDKGSSGHGFLFQDGKTIDLGAARGGNSSANDINDMGQIVGESMDGNNVTRPVLWSVVGEKVSALDLSRGLAAPDQWSGRANAINNNGEVVGQLQTAGKSHPFIWTASEGAKDLNALTKESDVANSSRAWVLEDGRGINNCGHIVTWGRRSSGESGYSLLLKPTATKPGC